MKNHKLKVIFIGHDDNQILKYIVNEEQYEFKEILIDELNDTLKADILICNKEILEVDNVKNKLQVDKIIEYEILMDNLSCIYKSEFYRNYDYNYLKSRIDIFSKKKDLDIVSVGVSHALFGIDENEAKYNNLSLASQDIYFSYNLFKYFIQDKFNTKYCILSLAYVSFNLDLSKMKNECYRINNVYMPILNKSHNYNIKKEDIYEPRWNEIENKVKDIYGDILNYNNLNNYFFYKLSKTYFKYVVGRGSYVDNLGNAREELRDQIAYLRCENHNKLLEFQDTINENISILNEFLTFLKEKDIKPVILVFPVSKYYRKYISQDFKRIFYSSLLSLDEGLKFEMLDLYEDNRFVTEDYVDTDHLSECGSIKATKIINEFLDCLD